MRRREFLQGLVAAALGATAEPGLPPQRHPTKRSEEIPNHTGEEPPAVDIETPSTNPHEKQTPWESVGRRFDMSETTRQELIRYMTDLMRPEEFNALRALARAEDPYSPEETLRDHATRIFHETIEQTPLGAYIEGYSPDLLPELVQLCVGGQVTAESRWINEPEGPDPVGYWQITRIGTQQIAEERGITDPSTIDRRNLTDATRGAAELHAAHYRMMSRQIARYQDTFEVSPREGCIPLVLTAYIYGPGLRHVIDWYTDTHQENMPHLHGLDRTLHMFDEARIAMKDNGGARFPRFGDHTHEYARKCIALFEISQFQDQLTNTLF